LTLHSLACENWCDQNHNPLPPTGIDDLRVIFQCGCLVFCIIVVIVFDTRWLDNFRLNEHPCLSLIVFVTMIASSI